MRRFGIALACSCAIAASPAMASEWWLVFLGGEKPGRLVVAVDEDFLDPVPFADNTYKLETFALMEHPKSPEWVTSNVLVDCTRGTLEEKLIQVSPRDDFVQRMPDQPARPPKDAVERKLVEFGCEMGPKTQAERIAMRDLNLTERGLFFMGPLTLGGIADFTWKNFWEDGTRPVVASKRSQEETDAKMAELAQRRKKALDEANAIAGTVIAADKRDTERTRQLMGLTEANGALANARKKREPPEVRNALEPWIGRGEAELTASWGAPTRFEDKGARRVLHFYKTGMVLGPDPSQGCGAGNMSVPDPNSRNGAMMCTGGGPARSETQIDCTASLEVRDGIIVDYITRGSCAAILGRPD